jgi:hypothetical protein
MSCSAWLTRLHGHQDGDDSLQGYPRDLTNSQWNYKILVRLIRPGDYSGHQGTDSEWQAIVSRSRLLPEDIEALSRARGKAGGAGGNVGEGRSLFVMKQQLDQDDPLVVAINRSKRVTLSEQLLAVPELLAGSTARAETLAEQVLEMFEYDLPVAQAWAADSKNAEELTQLANQIEAMVSACAGLFDTAAAA